MSETLGRHATIYLSSNGGSSYSLLGEVRDATYDVARDMHNATSHSDGAWKVGVAGHGQATLSVTCNYDKSDVAQAMILAAIMNATTLSVKVRPRGDTTGYEEDVFTANVTSSSKPMPTEGLLDLTATLTSTGTVTPQAIS
jgi:hypothetical protein